MTYKINITKSALSDIRSTALYISHTLMNKSASNRLLDNIQEKMDLLSVTPYMNPVVNDGFLASNGIRFQMIDKYMAFYIVDEETKTISVIRFIHSRRDWNYLLKNE